MGSGGIVIWGGIGKLEVKFITEKLNGKKLIVYNIVIIKVYNKK